MDLSQIRPRRAELASARLHRKNQPAIDESQAKKGAHSPRHKKKSPS